MDGHSCRPNHRKGSKNDSKFTNYPNVAIMVVRLLRLVEEKGKESQRSRSVCTRLNHVGARCTNLRNGRW